MKTNKHDIALFTKIMYGLAEDFGGAVSEDLIEMRFSALKEYPIEQISAAATWLIKNRKETFPAIPRTKEIIDAIEGLKAPKISIKSQSELQADLVLKYLRYYGRCGEGKFKDPITQGLMTSRWPYQSWAAYVKEDDLVWWRKEFIEAYQAYAERDEADAMALPQGGGHAGDLLDIARSSVKRLD